MAEDSMRKVPTSGDLQRTAHLKVPPPPPQAQPTQSPAQPAQSQTGGGTSEQKG